MSEQWPVDERFKDWLARQHFSRDRETIDEQICQILKHWGPDRHVDGHDELTMFAMVMMDELFGRQR